MTAPWATESALAQLRQMCADRLPRIKIAEALEVSETAVKGMIRSLGLQREPQRPQWMTPDNLALLDQLWPTTSGRLIAERVGASKNAVIGEARKRGLVSKPSPIDRTGQPSFIGPPAPPTRDRVIPRPIGPTLPVLASLQSPINAPAIRASRTLPVEPCCWVTTVGGRGKPWLYCDTDSVPGKPYCGDHQRDAHVINKKPAEASAIGGEA